MDRDHLESFWESSKKGHSHDYKGKIEGISPTMVELHPAKRVKEDKDMIASWEVMQSKIKAQFLSSDYEIQMYQRL